MLTWVRSEAVAKCSSISVGRRRPPRGLLGVAVVGITLPISEALSQESGWSPGHRVRLSGPRGGTEEQRGHSAGWETGRRDTQPGAAARGPWQSPLDTFLDLSISGRWSRWLRRHL